jgi:hypothetical protein
MKLANVPLWLFISLLAAAQSKTEHDMSVYVISNYTTASMGVFTDHTVIRQSNGASIGGAGYFEVWKHNNGFIIGGSFTPTDSFLFYSNPNFIDKWGLRRYKTDALYERRFHTTKKFQPYLGLGGFIIILWGGYAPAHGNTNTSGLDHLEGLIVPVGITTRLNSRVSFKSGLFVDIGKASTYGDTTYKSSLNVMFEPQVGLSFRLGKEIRQASVASHRPYGEHATGAVEDRLTPR